MRTALMFAPDRRDSTARKLGYVLVAAVFVLWALSALSSCTMLWQHTGPLKAAFPPSRTRCEPLDHNPDFPYSVAAPAADTTAGGSALQHQFPPELGRLHRIGIVCLFQQDEAKFRHGNAPKAAWGAELVQRLLANRRRYADMHNARFGLGGKGADAGPEYVLVEASGEVDPTRPAAWSKLLALKHHLPAFDYLWYVDMDVVLMRPEVQLDGIINVADQMHRREFEHRARNRNKQQQAQAQEQYQPPDLILTEDRNGANSGMMFLRNSPFSLWLLDELWACSEALSHATTATGPALPHSSGKRRGVWGQGLVYPFEYEQRAFHYLLQTDKWTGRGLPVYHGPVHDTAYIRSRVQLLPQCAMNSYSVHPLAWADPLFFPVPNRVQADFSPGVDFAVHFAGFKGKLKVDMLKHYLGLAEEAAEAHKRATASATGAGAGSGGR